MSQLRRSESSELNEQSSELSGFRQFLRYAACLPWSLAVHRPASRQVLHESIPELHDVAGRHGYKPITLMSTSFSLPATG
jgi:hypothetical protein